MVSFNILFTLSIGIIFLLRKTSESFVCQSLCIFSFNTFIYGIFKLSRKFIKRITLKTCKNVGSYLSCFDLKILKKMNVGSVPIGIPKDLNSFLIFLHSSSGITLSSYIRGVNNMKIMSTKR